MKPAITLFCSFVVGLSASALRASPAADWQFAIDVPGTKSKVFLWIPPACQKVRGIILGQQVILENKVLEDPIIRQAAADENLAIALICPGCLGYFDYKTQPVAKMLQDILDSLAKESGYDEIGQAPLLTIGHSGNGIFAWRIAYWNPARMIGVIGLHCMSSEPPPLDPKASVDGVPILDISGQYESWGHPDVPLETHWRWLRGGLLEFRGQSDDALMSELVDPGGCHFSSNEPLTRYMALFIRKAAEARLPATVPSDHAQPSTLREIAPESGWLTDLTLLTPSEHAPAPYHQYSGDPSLAFWHFDREMAVATENYRANAKGKRDQRITFVQDGKPLPAEWIETLKFEPIGDGMTMKVDADFLSATPAGVAGAGKPLGHAAGLIHFSLIGGWRGGGEQTGPDTFRIHPDHLGFSDNIMILAYQEGDHEYAWAEQPAQIEFPLKNTVGTPQKITFPAIADQPANTAAISLNATSDSVLPVEYYVLRGPAFVQGKKLTFTQLPPRTRYPVEVTVVAYQWGRTIDSPVQTAEPVEMNFRLTAASSASIQANQ
jgi:hypothetical protein